MADLRTLPFPRWADARPGEIERHMLGAGIDPGMAVKIAEGISGFLRERADELEANFDQTAAVVQVVEESVETHDHDGTDAPNVPAGNVSVTDSGGYWTGTDAEAVLQEVGADLAAVSASQGVSPFLLMGG